MRRKLIWTFAVTIGIATTGIPTPRSRAAAQKLAIAYRGASADAPENTRRAFQLAITQHADVIAPDLAVSRDGILVCLHDDTLERTTDAATIFPDRFRLTPEGEKTWLANDFTLAELRQLDAGSWMGPAFTGEPIPTWDEVVTLALGRAGLSPTINSATLYRSRGIDVVHLLAAAIRSRGLDRPQSLDETPIAIHALDRDTLRELSRALPTVPRVVLAVLDDDVVGEERLREMASFATGVALEKSLIARHPDVIPRAHTYGLTVSGWTFADGDTVRFNSTRDEMDHFLYTLGLDAAFTSSLDQFPRRRIESTRP